MSGDQGTSIDQIGQHFSALGKRKLRLVVQKAQKMLAAPTGGGVENCVKRAVGLKKTARQRAKARAWKYPA